MYAVIWSDSLPYTHTQKDGLEAEKKQIRTNLFHKHVVFCERWGTVHPGQNDRQQDRDRETNNQAHL